MHCGHGAWIIRFLVDYIQSQFGHSPLVLHGKELKWDKEGRVEGSVSEAGYVNPSGNLEIWKIVSAIRGAEEGKMEQGERSRGEKG